MALRRLPHIRQRTELLPPEEQLGMTATSPCFISTVRPSALGVCKGDILARIFCVSVSEEYNADPAACHKNPSHFWIALQERPIEEDLRSVSAQSPSCA